MQHGVIGFKEGRGVRALSDFMHSSIVLEPESHYGGHWESGKSRLSFVTMTFCSTSGTVSCSFIEKNNLFKPLERCNNYSSKSVLSAPKRVLFNTEGVEGREGGGGGRDDRRKEGRHTSPGRGLCTLKGGFFILLVASIDIRRHFQSLVGPITTKDPHHKMRAYERTKCTLAKKNL